MNPVFHSQQLYTRWSILTSGKVFRTAINHHKKGVLNDVSDVTWQKLYQPCNVCSSKIFRSAGT